MIACTNKTSLQEQPLMQSCDTGYSQNPDMNTAIHLNNVACQHMAAESYETATSMLKTSIKTLKECIKSYENNITTPEAHHVGTLPPALSFLSFKDPSNMHRNNYSKWYLHAYPIQISEETFRRYKGHADEYSSFAIIFNLALCHHQQALRCPSRSVFLQRAVALYSHAQKLLTSYNLNIDVPLTLALYNNLGHAHHSLEDHASASKCFQNVFNLIFFCASESPLLPSTEDQENEPLDGFMMNAMHFIGGTSGAPAA